MSYDYYSTIVVYNRHPVSDVYLKYNNIISAFSTVECAFFYLNIETRCGGTAYSLFIVKST